eukprot:403335309
MEAKNLDPQFFEKVRFAYYDAIIELEKNENPIKNLQVILDFLESSKRAEFQDLHFKLKLDLIYRNFMFKKFLISRIARYFISNKEKYDQQNFNIATQILALYVELYWNLNSSYCEEMTVLFVDLRELFGNLQDLLLCKSGKMIKQIMQLQKQDQTWRNDLKVGDMIEIMLSDDSGGREKMVHLWSLAIDKIGSHTLREYYNKNGRYSDENGKFDGIDSMHDRTYNILSTKVKRTLGIITLMPFLWLAV